MFAWEAGCIGFIVAFLGTVFCITLLRPIAIRIGFVDHPDARKQHGVPVPLIGGVGILFGFMLALLSLPISLQPFRALLGGSAVLLLMGIVDDFRELSSRLRLVGQWVVACFTFGYSGIILTTVGHVHGLMVTLPYAIGLFFTLTVCVSNVNAMNMLDGQDGLAGGIALGQAILLCWLSAQVHLYALTYLIVPLIAALCAFLCFNAKLPGRARAVVFMGDAGSTFLALILTYIAISLSQAQLTALSPITVLWIMAFPLWDLVSVVIRRVRAGLSPMTAGRDHIHHILQMKGMSTTVSTYVLVLFSAGVGILGLVFWQQHVAEWCQALCFFAAWILYTVLVLAVHSRCVHSEETVGSVAENLLC